MTHPLQAASGMIVAGPSQGTGYLIAPDRAATCAHVVKQAGEGGSVSITFEGVTRSATAAAGVA